jgi:RecA/RadA recombinase
MSKKKREDKPRKELPLGERQRQYALTVLMRNKDAFSMIKDQINSQLFNTEAGRANAVVWAVLKDYYNIHSDLPVQEVLLAELENRLSLTDEFDDEALEALDEFIEAAYAVPAEDLKVNVAMKYLSQMITEQTQNSLLAEIQNGGVVSDLPLLLQTHIAVADAAKAMTSGKAPLPFPDDPEEITAIELEPTGVAFLDLYMNGGMARKEVNGFCGPYGSCKTTLGIQLAVERARYSMHQARTTQTPPQRVYYFSWEEDLDQLRPRVLSYAAQITRSSLEGKGFQKKLSLSTLSSMKQYERELFREQIAAGVIVGEYDRMMNSMAELNLNLRIMDFSGFDPNYQTLAGQMVEGIVTAIKQDQRIDNNPGVSLVIVDYAGAAAERAILAGNAQRTDLRHLVGKMPLHLKNLVAAPFNCQVWCLHQLGTQANSQAPGSAPKSTDTAEAKNFFENVNFGFMVGKPNTEGLTRLTNGKQRRAARREDTVVHIRGELSRVDDASKRYVATDNMILSRSDANQFVRNIIRDEDNPRRQRPNNDIGLD